MKQDAEEVARRSSRIDSTGPILKPPLIDDIPYADDEVIQCALIAWRISKLHVIKRSVVVFVCLFVSYDKI